jgi:hypothetical protein
MIRKRDRDRERDRTRVRIDAVQIDGLTTSFVFRCTFASDTDGDLNAFLSLKLTARHDDDDVTCIAIIDLRSFVNCQREAQAHAHVSVVDMGERVYLYFSLSLSLSCRLIHE